MTVPFTDFENAIIRRTGSAIGAVDWTLEKILREIGPRVVSVKEFGAKPDGGTTDNLAPFLNAGEHLLGLGGGTLYVPGTVGGGSYYGFSAPLNFQNCPSGSELNGKCTLLMVGDGMQDEGGSRLSGNFAGRGVLEHHYGKQILRGIIRLGVTNGHSAGLGVIWNGTHCGHIDQCRVAAGAVGILNNNEGYVLSISNCDLYGYGNRGIGAALGQASVSHSSMVGWDVGCICYNAGSRVSSCRFEVNRFGFRAGLDVRAIVRATSSGTTFTVHEIYYGAINLNEVYVINAGHKTPGMYTYMFGGAAGAGVKTTNVPTYLNNETAILTFQSQVAGLHVDSITYERNDCAIDHVSGGGCSYNGQAVTGTVGTPRDVANITWASGVATVTTAQPHAWANGPHRVTIEEVPGRNDGWGINHVLATVTDATHFTYPLPVSPTAAYFPTMTYSGDIQFGVRIRGANATAFNGLSIGGNFEQAALDLYYDSNTLNAGLTFNGLTLNNTMGQLYGYGGTQVIPPASNMKATFTTGEYRNLELLFNELPGNVGGPANWSATFGMEYLVINCPTTAIGSAVSAGTATSPQKYKLFCSVGGTPGTWLRMI